MDKQEFSIKIERLKRAVEEKDYFTALKIVQSIDWERVKSLNLLGLAASVYEANDRLEDAKAVLTIALERSANGKRILYKLTELAVRSGDLKEAEALYQEYATIAPSDPAGLLLQYMIMKVRHEPYPQLIKCLELYNEYEPDDKWMYELATTYEAAGRIQDAVGLCDRIALMFGNSPYVVKALKLKQKYVKLSDEQRASLYPSSIAGAGAHYLKEEEPRYTVHTTEREEEPEAAPETLADQLAAERVPDEDFAFEMYLKEHDPLKDQNVPEEEQPIVPEEVIRNADGPVPVERVYQPEEPAPAPEPEPVEVRTPIPVGRLAEESAAAPAEAEAFKALEEEHLNEGFMIGDEYEASEETPAQAEDTPAAALAEPVAEAAAPAEPEVPVAEPVTETVAPAEPEVPAEPEITEEKVIKTPAMSNAKIAAAAGAFPAGAPQPQARTSFTVSKPAEEPKKEEPVQPAQPVFVPGLHLIIEALEEEEGVEIARKELAVVYRLRGESRKVAKAGAEKLNKFGDEGAVEEKIGDRDLVISAAGDLTGDVADQLYELLEDRRSERSIIFVDTPEGLDMLEETLPELFDICDILTDEDARAKDYSAALSEERDALEARQEAKQEERPATPIRGEEPAGEEEQEEEERPASRKPLTTKKNDLMSKTGNVPFHMPESDDEVLELDDFAQYCIHYANGMGCSISGKTLLALYEKIEIMEEDGIALTRLAAEDCVEEAADHAEHPGMKGLFRKKYDKDDMLILREEDFIN